MTMEVQKIPNWFRVLLFVTGGIAIALSGFVMAYPIAATLFLLVFVGIALIAIGISNIADGLAIKRMSKVFRAIDVIIGIAAIIGGFFALTHPVVALVSLIWLVTIFVFIYGAGLVATGVSRDNKSKGVRIASIVLGSIVLIFSGVLLEFPGLTLPVMIVLLSITLFIKGIDRIIAGAIGKVIVIGVPSTSKSTSTKTTNQTPETESQANKDSKGGGGK